MKFDETSIPGAYLITPKKIEDNRGLFVKTFHADLYAEHGLETDFREEYYSTSFKNVLRGMHFQLPPHAHAKLVYCVVGQVMDVILDLRKNSPTFGKTFSTILDAEGAKLLYIPKGVTHGFLSLSDQAMLIYKTSTVHNPASDSGILWDSFGFKWPIDEPILSDRDQNHPPLSEFISPF